MHPNFDNACQNVVNHVSNAHTAFAGHSVACVDATSKSPLGRKRPSTLRQCTPDDSQSGYWPDMRSPRDSMSRGERPAPRTRLFETQTRVAEDAPAALTAAASTPAAVWAALVIARALAS